MVENWYSYGHRWGSLSVEQDTSGNDVMYIVNNSITGKMYYPASDDGKRKAEEAYNMLKYNAYIEYRICN